MTVNDAINAMQERLRRNRDTLRRDLLAQGWDEQEAAAAAAELHVQQEQAMADMVRQILHAARIGTDPQTVLH